jgi:hypothetical protein
LKQFKPHLERLSCSQGTAIATPIAVTIMTIWQTKEKEALKRKGSLDSTVNANPQG